MKRTLKKAAAPVMFCLMCALCILPAFADALVPVYEEYALVFLNDGEKSYVKVTPFVDKDKDGTVTLDEVLEEAHKQFDTPMRYKSEDSEFGKSLVTLMGVTNGGAYGYYINNQPASSLLDPVKGGDTVSAFVYTDTVTYSDVYSYFDPLVSYNMQPGLRRDFRLCYLELDESWNPVEKPVVGAEIFIDGKSTGIFTDSDGKAKITLPENNSGKTAFRVTASGGNVNTDKALCILDTGCEIKSPDTADTFFIAAAVALCVCAAAAGIFIRVRAVKKRGADE